MTRYAVGVKSSESPAEARLKRLAGRIGALAAKDEEVLRNAQEIAQLRHAAARELYTVCAEFVTELNRLLPQPELSIDPPDYREGSFSDIAPNLIQISVRGRILQLEYEAAETLLSTEEFRIPYTLAGSVRAFNQELLEKDLIEEQLIFYTVERHRKMWRFFDARTYRSGPVDQGYLVTAMEQLL